MKKETLRNLMLRAVTVLAGALLVFVALLVLFTLLFVSDVDRILRRENRLYEQNLPYVEECLATVRDEAAYLQMRDEGIYREVFKVEAPKVESLVGADILVEDKIDFRDITQSSAMQAERAGRMAEKVEKDWKAVFEMLERDHKSLPPLVSPTAGLDHRSVGATTGMKLSPFYKVSVRHEGIDLVASEGTAVLCTAPGVITSVERYFGGMGNMVTVTHTGGYVTRYAHLADISVYKGQRVKTLDKIGTVGDSGRSFTTHLHYEVEHNGQKMDPSYYFYGSLMPDEFSKVLVTASSMGQSMD